ncbi:nuclear transport factor 2 family protein [Shewanella gelidii]|nr:nuclear transport factor 2 family protein [Shewanella gelidii]MCL1096696.1 nuclear transport factor 2 family protein [Shewanella gelidii]
MSLNQLVFASAADMPKEQQLANEYMKILTSRDYEKLKRYYSRSSLLYDQTANKKFTGQRHILAFLKRAQKGVIEYNFNIEHMFNTGSLVVMIGNYHYQGPGDQFGKPGKIVKIAIPGVTTLKLDMNTRRVRQHTDLIDYQTMTDQLAEQ